MPRTQRKPEEIEAFREKILTHAVELMTQAGYHNFSMRKLAQPLGIAAKTIYNYYRNKDELYLAILTKGFEMLHAYCLAAYQSQQDPLKRVDAMIDAYLEFGLEQVNFYNLMFIWHVPKYNDYVGTAMEPTALVELETALKNPHLFVKAIQACTGKTDVLAENDAQLIVIHMWTQLHGFIAGYNNTLLDYMYACPMELKKPMLDRIKAYLRAELKRYQQTGDRVL